MQQQDNDLQADAAAANLLSEYLAVRDVPEVTSPRAAADLCVLCGSAVLATVYAAVRALQAGTVPCVLISGGSGHSTIHLYKAIREHPVWHHIPTHEGRHEAEVLRDLLLALGVSEQQLLPLEVESLNCGGNARCSMELTRSLGLQPRRVLMIQDPTMQRRTQATFSRWWRELLASSDSIISFSPLVPQLRVDAAGSGLEFVPESVTVQPPVPQQQIEAWTHQQEQKKQQQEKEKEAGASNAGAAETGARGLSQAQGVWGVERFISLLLGEVVRLRDDPSGYGPKGKNFIDHIEIPAAVEAAWARLLERYPHLLRS